MDRDRDVEELESLLLQRAQAIGLYKPSPVRDFIDSVCIVFFGAAIVLIWFGLIALVSQIVFNYTILFPIRNFTWALAGICLARGLLTFWDQRSISKGFRDFFSAAIGGSLGSLPLAWLVNTLLQS